jgi:exopolysaccharide biosynthesis polyprenyl glycosylphosphotransferase
VTLDAVAAALGTVVIGRCLGTGWHEGLLMAAAVVPSWIGLVATTRGYQRFAGSAAAEWRELTLAGTSLAGLICLGAYLVGAQPERGLIAGLPAVAVLSALGRVLHRQLLRRAWAAGRRRQRVVLVGAAAEVSGSIGRLRVDVDHGVTVVGACLSDAGVTDSVELDRVLTGELGDLPALIAGTRPDLVMVLPGSGITGADLRRLAWTLEPTGAELMVCAGIIETARHRVTVRSLAHAPLFHIAGARLSGPSRLVKEAFDRVAAALGLLLLAPLLGAVALAIWLGDGGSPFFHQTRVGRGGRAFRIVKFRTMVVDAEARRAALVERNECDRTLFKIAEDPRTTPIGRVLRRYSVDELPQLLNVVRGEMSLVGPRPPLPCEVAEYSADMRRRLLVKPGMTGLWQVSGRSQLSWAQTELLDVRYVENWSLGLDLSILLRTARAVIAGTGAY